MTAEVSRTFTLRCDGCLSATFGAVGSYATPADARIAAAEAGWTLRPKISQRGQPFRTDLASREGINRASTYATDRCPDCGGQCPTCAGAPPVGLRCLSCGLGADPPAAKPRSHSEWPDLLTVDQFAEQVQIGRTTVFSLIKSGEVKSVNIRRLRRIPSDEVPRFIQRLRSQAVAKNADPAEVVETGIAVPGIADEAEART